MPLRTGHGRPPVGLTLPSGLSAPTRGTFWWNTHQNLCSVAPVSHLVHLIFQIVHPCFEDSFWLYDVLVPYFVVCVDAVYSQLAVYRLGPFIVYLVLRV